MTEQQARTTANIIMATVAVGAACYVLRTPALRRAAWQLARQWVAGPVAVWVATEVRHAWDESGRAPRRATEVARDAALGSQRGV